MHFRSLRTRLLLQSWINDTASQLQVKRHSSRIWMTVTEKMADVRFTRMHCGQKSLKKQTDVCWMTSIREEVIFFVLLKFSVLSCFSWPLFSSVLAWWPQCIHWHVKCTCCRLFRYGQLRDIDTLLVPHTNTSRIPSRCSKNKFFKFSSGTLDTQSTVYRMNWLG